VIRVVLSTPKKFNLISWLIRKATRYPASHASIHLEGKGTLKGRGIVLEATGHGVGVIPDGWWHAENRVIRSFALVRQQEIGGEAYREVWDESNVPYDFLGVARFAGRLLVRWLFGWRIRHSPDTPERMFCSELVARWLMAFSRLTAGEGQEPIKIAPEMMAPGDLVPLMDGMGFFEETSCEPPEPSSSAIST
jgi:hypothetical protein